MATRKLTVVAAVKRDLEAIGALDKALKESALAASALALAAEMDKSSNSATSKSMCARALLETLNRLRELAPVVEEADRVDELAHRFDAKVARLPAA